MNEQETPEKLDRLIESGSNPARSTFTPTAAFLKQCPQQSSAYEGTCFLA